MFGFDDAIAAGLKIVDKFVEDKDQAAKIKLQVLQMDHDTLIKELDLDSKVIDGQNAINVEEAKSDSLFKSGWRPYVGWVCGAAFSWAFLFQPILFFILAANGVQFTTPPLDLSTMLPVLFGMLGLGGLRTFEKYKGVR